ncbi:LacI family DNA-binding transcriptional regulator [Pengzhenrongella sicca]|nr:LacI family DNA-binding transcriptional regulator [Pengzhenrongella sicca]
MTISKIALAAGVSVPTVSKVLNGRADVSPATRAKVEALIEEHGYRRRRAAVTKGSGMIDLVFHELGNLWALEIIRGVERVAREEGLAVVLAECEGGTSPRQEWLDGVLARRPKGVIMVFSDLDPSQRRQLEARNIPCVVVDPTGEPTGDYPAIGSANWSGGLAATRHLLELGHKRIGAIGGPEWVWCSRARLDGFRAALEHAGLQVDPELIRYGDFHVERGYEHGLSLLGLDDPPTAIFAGNDLQALGLYKAARELGVRIPDDLSVVGYDDLSVAEWIGPALTTVRQPLLEMSLQATRLVLSLARGEHPQSTRIDLATTLIVRQSTARVASPS